MLCKICASLNTHLLDCHLCCINFATTKNRLNLSPKMQTMDDFGLKGQSLEPNNSEEIQPIYHRTDTKEVTTMTTIRYFLISEF